jgi:hypothetical protein
VIANDGTDGQMIRGRGALTFRIGDFFSGADKEQMRLTEDGNLGIGTTKPTAKLDVAGMIRAREGFMFSDGSMLKLNEKGVLTRTNADGVAPSSVTTQNQIAKFTDNAGTVGDSVIAETGGNVAIGGPVLASANFDFRQSNPTGDVLQRIWNQFGDVTPRPLAGAKLRYVAAVGGTSQLQLTDNAEWLMSIAGNNSMGMQFRVRDTTDPNTEAGLSAAARMTILRNGNVGIGTPAPLAKLDIQGGADGNGFTDQPEAMAFQWRAGGYRHWIRTRHSAILGSGNAIDFFVNNSASAGGSTGPDLGSIPVMTLDSGRVGIGTTNPVNGKLEVVATGSGAGVYGRSPSGAGVYARSDDGYGVYASSTSNYGVVGVSTSGSGVFGGGSYIGVWGSGSSFGVFGTSSSGTGVVAQSASGNLVEGYSTASSTSVRKFHITNDGTYVAGSDFAEALPARGDRAGYEPGDVLVVSTKAPGKVEKASRPYDPRVAGIYSTRPGMLGADKNGTSPVDADEVPVAIVGIVPTKVSAMNGRIRVGDLLTTSSTPGYAMRCANRVKCVGAIVGKALEPLAGGKGVIKMLVMLR